MTIRGGKHGGGEGMRGSQHSRETCFQLPTKRGDVFCLVKFVWQPVPEGGCSRMLNLLKFTLSTSPEEITFLDQQFTVFVIFVA